MTDHAISALRAKRVEVAEQTREAEKKATRLRAALANLDAAIAILTPEHPDYIAPQRRYRSDPYFRRDELSRLLRETLRDASKPLAAGEIAAGIIAAKRFPDAAHLAVTKMIVTRLGALAKRGEIHKSGTTRDARWSVITPETPL
jgi:hypothetical protein